MPDLPQGNWGIFDRPEPATVPPATPRPDLPLGAKTPFKAVMDTTPSSPQTPPGMVERGNIDLQTRPITHNPDGSTSSVYSASFHDGNQEVLVPLVSDGGKILTVDQARQQYQKTGQHLGKFATPAHADAYAQQLHEDYANGKIGGYPAADSGGAYPGNSEAAQGMNRIHQGISRGFAP